MASTVQHRASRGRVRRHGFLTDTCSHGAKYNIKLSCYVIGNPSLTLLIGVILFGLGAGYSASIRGAITSLTAVHDRALIYSTMSMLDTIGSLIGAPLWPLVYRLGLKAGGFLLGLPFAVAAAMFALVYSSVEVAKFTATAYF